MYLVFLDGSGNTGLNLTHPTSTTYLLMGLAVHGNRIRALEDEMGAVHGLPLRAGEPCAGLRVQGERPVSRARVPARPWRPPSASSSSASWSGSPAAMARG